MPNWAALFVAVAWPMVRKVLGMLGIGWISYEAITALLNNVITAAQSSWGQVSGAMLQLCSLGGVPQVMGIIAGALVARGSFLVLSKLGKLATA